MSTGDSESGRQPIYSIGAVASMLGVETATVRKWEDRYGIVVPARSKGEQRVYSRDELEQLRFVVDLVASGTTPAAAHRMLADRSRSEAPFGGNEEARDELRLIVSEPPDAAIRLDQPEGEEIVELGMEDIGKEA